MSDKRYLNSYKTGDIVVCKKKNFLYAKEPLEVGRTYRVCASNPEGSRIYLEGLEQTWYYSYDFDKLDSKAAAILYKDSSEVLKWEE